MSEILKLGISLHIVIIVGFFLTANSQVLFSLVEYFKYILMIMILKYSLLDNVPKGALSKRE